MSRNSVSTFHRKSANISLPIQLNCVHGVCGIFFPSCSAFSSISSRFRCMRMYFYMVFLTKLCLSTLVYFPLLLFHHLWKVFFFCFLFLFDFHLNFPFRPQDEMNVGKSDVYAIFNGVKYCWICAIHNTSVLSLSVNACKWPHVKWRKTSIWRNSYIPQ